MAIDKDDLLSKQQSEVDSKLWAMANNLRGNMDASEFKNYILGLIFYKFLSDKITKTINDELAIAGILYTCLLLNGKDYWCVGHKTAKPDKKLSSFKKFSKIIRYSFRNH